MARWRLINAHYLKTIDTFWEQKEIDQFTGKQAVKRYPVPRHLDPKTEEDWNYTLKRPDSDVPEENSIGIIVCWEGKGKPRDIIFIGDPTPDMIPLDKEAAELSSQLTVKTGFDPFAAVAIGDEANYSNHLLNQAAELFGEAQNKQSEATAEIVKLQGEMKEIMSMLAQVTVQNTQLLQQLAGARRV